MINERRICKNRRFPQRKIYAKGNGKNAEFIRAVISANRKKHLQTRHLVSNPNSGEQERFWINGLPISRELLNELGAEYFSEQGLGQLWRDLEEYGRVYISFVYINNSRRLERANKKIADLEREVAQFKNFYRTR